MGTIRNDNKIDASHEFAPTRKDVKHAKESMQVINAEDGPTNKPREVKAHKDADQ